ncbi:dihydroxyacetone kinase subunit DhaK [Anaeromyxobacter oryzae]|uniref:Dihydroxyacetone kinase subunit DhaK n=1 Tax=Anaeromyxobacter oryzae TaxID=2918170 RepID=A0ABM7WPA6_9BACT|nr:dihydroxyacetone kinase subunit DhaK [Anaeromyxobacter oryzae]BDG01301.1 dihydroxyacetone kinase subunit DhaK [Anaeromyxobacter oryzae]
MLIKKIVNDPRNVVPELLDGLVAAYGGRVRKLADVNAVVRTELQDGKVGVLLGGGSGHEPLFAGFVGEGLADAAACGNVFAAPSPDTILAATRAVNRGAGVLYVYGNYAGDVMNFDMAAELAADEGIRVETVRVWDDAASAPAARTQDRRGIAGDLFVIKIAGAVAASGASLAEAHRVTSRARDATRSIGVAVAAGSIPETGARTFELPDDAIEIGMGLHGEPGVSRERLLPADALVDRMLDVILPDLPFRGGDRVCLLVNDLGATTTMELLIVTRRAHQILRARDVRVQDTLVGSFCTSQEMAGFSLSLLRLDPELERHWTRPAASLALTRG